jgi:hypothetical protein
LAFMILKHWRKKDIRSILPFEKVVFIRGVRECFSRHRFEFRVNHFLRMGG